jgi:5-methylcytosine-specific restriction enzyme subunit McrC
MTDTTADRTPSPATNRNSPVVVQLAEWQRVGPADDPRLVGLSLAQDSSAQRLADSLRGCVDLREGYHGLEIASTSFVGRIDVGSLRIVVIPKIPSMPLANLLRYAYGLRDIALIDETYAPTVRHGLHDLLIAMLLAEVEELLYRGLSRRYVPITEKLDSPRGRIIIEELIRNGGLTEPRLSCRHFERQTNWHLNQVLRMGLEAAARMTSDRDLRRKVYRLAAAFGEVGRNGTLTKDEIERAERGLTRLTAANGAALEIIRLLFSMLGVAFEQRNDLTQMRGFLFDMNLFFQRLLSRLFRENITTCIVKDEWPIRHIFAFAPDANPKNRSTPTLRPDFALFRRNRLSGFMDAKYRDVWEKGLPSEWLYQLSIYALASPTKTSILLYATMNDSARDERLEIRQPLQGSSEGYASVILRPVLLSRLSKFVDPDRTTKMTDDRRRWAEELILPRVQGRESAPENRVQEVA